MGTSFSALSVCPSLSRSVSTIGDYANSNKSRSKEDRTIEEGISLLITRAPNGKIIFKCWTCNEFSHYASKCPKREKKYKNNFKSWIPRDCLCANKDDEFEERV